MRSKQQFLFRLPQSRRVAILELLFLLFQSRRVVIHGRPVVTIWILVVLVSSSLTLPLFS